jgi:hypothetical protein
MYAMAIVSVGKVFEVNSAIPERDR